MITSPLILQMMYFSPFKGTCFLFFCCFSFLSLSSSVEELGSGWQGEAGGGVERGGGQI